ncbi:response regulator containing a CheY-like receiver domain and an HTH DNA-binding domain [Saprospira grandis DSM 2844]|uniref:Response regulator containing a CheY-like receiver domain and an HTH DNA-binding domain n=2 Tax=Saprospira TaxID=1007 RepID=J0P7T6_9BACT|nr:response regulator containing a CheY-like receiver domain and an HTH DNA-binding domain [Saprospira grandis DSM 2844]
MQLLILGENKLVSETLVELLAEQSSLALAYLALPACASCWLNEQKEELRQTHIFIINTDNAYEKGVECLKTLRGAYPEAPIFVVDQHESPSLIALCAAAGANAYFSLSGSLNKLEQAISSCLINGQ